MTLKLIDLHVGFVLWQTQSFVLKAEDQRILCPHWSLAFSFSIKLFLFKWISVLQTLTNSKHTAVSKLLLHKCCFFYSFRNNQLSESFSVSRPLCINQIQIFAQLPTEGYAILCNIFLTHKSWMRSPTPFFLSPSLQNQNWTNIYTLPCNCVQTCCLIVLSFV